MNDEKLSVREIQESDINHIIKYWLESDDDFLIGMGVDLKKMPEREFFRKMLSEPLSQSYKEKSSYCIIWLHNEKPVGHSNVNKIKFGEEAYMHLHLWSNDVRRKGNGTAFVKMSIPYFFKNLDLKKLYCEPYALNQSPNRALKKIGFEFVKEHMTIPGYLNFEQQANLWVLTLEKYKSIMK